MRSVSLLSMASRPSLQYTRKAASWFNACPNIGSCSPIMGGEGYSCFPFFQSTSTSPGGGYLAHYASMTVFYGDICYVSSNNPNPATSPNTNRTNRWQSAGLPSRQVNCGYGDQYVDVPTCFYKDCMKGMGALVPGSQPLQTQGLLINEQHLASQVIRKKKDCGHCGGSGATAYYAGSNPSRK